MHKANSIGIGSIGAANQRAISGTAFMSSEKAIEIIDAPAQGIEVCCVPLFIFILVLPFGKNAVGLGLAENNDRYITRNVVVMNSYGDRRTMPKSKKSVASSSNWHSKTGAFTNWRSNSNVTKILLSATRRRDGQSSWQASKHHRPAFPGQFRGRLTLKSRHSFSIRVVYKLCKESVIRPSFFLFFFFFSLQTCVCVAMTRFPVAKSNGRSR
jgi:hypothetical protein